MTANSTYQLSGARLVYACIMYALLALGLAMTGCRSFRVRSTSDVRTKDSVAIRIIWKDSTAVRVHLVERDSVVIVRRDSAVGIAGGSVSLILGDTSGGREVASFLAMTNVMTKRGHVTVRANRQPNGAIHVECTADSLTIVVTDLESRDVYRLRVIDSLKAVVGQRNDSAVFHHNHQVTVETERRITGLPWWVKCLISVLAAVVVVWFIIKQRWI